MPDKRDQRGHALAERILSWSLREGLGSGGRLPTERQLAADLGVSRAAVRHALGIMEARGHISCQVGRGTYLRPSAPLPPAPTPGPVAGGPVAGGDGQPAAFAPADVMLVRRLLEPPAMPLAVAWATASDFGEMDRCLDGGDRAASYEEFEAWDLGLHHAIMVATHSPLLVTIYASIAAARRGQMWGDLKRRTVTAERRCQYQEHHRAIVAALKTRDANGAVKAMRDHLARVSDHLNATDPAAGVWQ